MLLRLGWETSWPGMTALQHLDRAILMLTHRRGY